MQLSRILIVKKKVHVPPTQNSYQYLDTDSSQTLIMLSSGKPYFVPVWFRMFGKYSST
jgi:hypothetical protein